MLTLCQPENGFFLLPVRMTSVDKFVARRKFAVEEVTHRAQVLVPDLLVRLREVLHPDLLREQMVEGLNVS